MGKAKRGRLHLSKVLVKVRAHRKKPAVKRTRLEM